MKSRLDLHEELCELLGSRNVYFQPPESKKLSYPCIVYKRYDEQIEHANNKPYFRQTGYELTLISKDPDTDLIDKLLYLPYCRYNRHFNADNLNHDVFLLYTI